VACPLLEGIDLSGAKGVLVLVTAAKGSLKLSESRLAMNTINAYASPDAHVIYGAAYDDSLGDEIRVTVVATGLSRPTRAPADVGGAGRSAHRYRQRPTHADGHGCRWAPAPLLHRRSGPGRLRRHGVPSVWRTNRTQAAARVDALAAWTIWRSRPSCASRLTDGFP
jgi:cell division protein FtsZ